MKGSDEMSGKEARNAYMRSYRMRNREKLNEKERQRRKANPERYKKYVSDYWERKAQATKGCET